MKQYVQPILRPLGLYDLGKAVWGLGRTLYWAAFHALRVRGWTPWQPLVPEAAFRDACRRAIAAATEGGREFGAYLEFGVSRGTSMACMQTELQAAGLGHARVIGFDSFQGLPEGSEAQGWDSRAFRSTVPATRRYLKKNGADLRRIELIRGWFSDTCTTETAARLGLTKASVVMIDCDIYTAACEALTFAGLFIDDRAVLIFDDWGWRSDIGELGEKEAFEAFLGAHPHLRAVEMPAYLPQARMFVVERA